MFNPYLPADQQNIDDIEGLDEELDPEDLEDSEETNFAENV